MPIETFIIEPASTDRERSHQDVAHDITAAFAKIKSQRGQFLAAIALSDKTSTAGHGGHPDGAAYIVADFPDTKSA